MNSVEEAKEEPVNRGTLNFGKFYHSQFWPAATEDKCKASKYISWEKLNKVLQKVIKIINTKSTKNRCQIEIVGDNLEVKTIDLLGPKTAKTENKPKDVKISKEKEKEKKEEEEDWEIDEADSDDEEDADEEKDREEYKIDKSDEKLNKSK